MYNYRSRGGPLLPSLVNAAGLDEESPAQKIMCIRGGWERPAVSVNWSIHRIAVTWSPARLPFVEFFFKTLLQFAEAKYRLNQRVISSFISGRYS